MLEHSIYISQRSPDHPSRPPTPPPTAASTQAITIRGHEFCCVSGLTASHAAHRAQGRASARYRNNPLYFNDRCTNKEQNRSHNHSQAYRTRNQPDFHSHPSRIALPIVYSIPRALSGVGPNLPILRLGRSKLITAPLWTILYPYQTFLPLIPSTQQPFY